MADRTIEVQIKAVDKAGSTFKSIGKALAIGLGVVSAAGGAAMLAIKDMVKEASAAEEVSAKLAAVLKSTGGAAGVTSEMANDLANSLMQVTRFEDEAILSAETMLLRFKGIGKDIFPEVTKATLDLAESLGMDLNSAARLLGKALETPGVGLLRLKMAGVAFSEEQLKMIQGMAEAGNLAGAQRMILDELKTSIGGTAEAMGNTMAGKLEILKNTLGNLKETIGGALIPALTELATKLIETLNTPEVQLFIQQLATWMGTVLPAAINKGLGYLSTVALPKMSQALAFVNSHWDQFKVGLIAIGAILAAGTIAAAITSLIAALNPVTLIIMAIVAVGALLYKAWTSDWAGIQTRLTEAWVVIQPVLQQIWDWLSINIPLAIQAVKDWWDNTLIPAFESINEAAIKVGEGITDIIAWFIGLPDRIKSAVTGQIDALVRIGTAIVEGIKTGVQKAWDTFKRWIVQKIESIISSVLGALGIHSPSAVFAEIGFNMVAGLQEGWDAGMAAFTAQVGRGLSMGVPSLSLAGGGGGRGSSTAYNSVGGDTYNVSVNDQTSAALLMAMVDERRRARLYASMGVGV